MICDQYNQAILFLDENITSETQFEPEKIVVKGIFSFTMGRLFLRISISHMKIPKIIRYCL